MQYLFGWYILLKSDSFVLYKNQFIASWRNRLLSSYLKLDFLYIECKDFVDLIDFITKSFIFGVENCWISPLFFT